MSSVPVGALGQYIGGKSHQVSISNWYMFGYYVFILLIYVTIHVAALTISYIWLHNL